MIYEEAIKYVENIGKFGMNLGLDRIKRLCSLMGNPEKSLRVIHVGGTNGKGSTVTFISSVLMSEGYRVGIYTSPYIERFTERIRINHEEIAEDDIARLVGEIKPLIDILIEEGFDHPTEFEIITACAFKYFKEKQVDFVVLEVGLGGRFDATNVVDPLLSVITTISYDHMNVLGDTLSKIAFEKAGIIKKGKPVVIYPQEKEAIIMLLDAAGNKGAKVYPVEDIKYEIKSDSKDGIIFNAYAWKTYEGLKIGMLGEHQVMNALTALKAIEVLRLSGIKISDISVYKGFESARWPGRFEIINKSPYIVLDGGHNNQGIEALVKAIRYYFKGMRVVTVCGMLKDKEYMKMIKSLSEITDSFITVMPDSPRALTAEELKDVIEGFGKKAVPSADVEDAVRIGVKSVGYGDVLLFCGSLYMIGHARSTIRNIMGLYSNDRNVL